MTLRDPDYYHESRHTVDNERLQVRYLYEIAARLDAIAQVVEEFDRQQMKPQSQEPAFDILPTCPGCERRVGVDAGVNEEGRCTYCNEPLLVGRRGDD